LTESFDQHAVGSGGARIYQAGGDLRVGLEQRPVEPGLISIAPPIGRLGTRVYGRDDLVADVVEHLGGRVIALHGAGGYGKTTVALSVVREVRSSSVVWWVDATTATSLGDGLREVALNAGAKSEDVARAWSGQASAPDLLWRALTAFSGPWLLVIDGADDAQLLSAAGARVSDGTGWVRVPREGGALLVTTRDHSPDTWGPSVSLRPVAVLEPADGAALLEDIAPCAGTAVDALRLAERLGGLPLALKAVGRYLVVVREAPDLPGSQLARTFAEYLESPESWIPELAVTASHGVPDRELLNRTWELSLDLLTARGLTMARPLLRLLSRFAQEPVPHFLLDDRVLSRFPGFQNPTWAGLRATLKGLSDLQLLDTVQIVHPFLVQENGNPVHQQGAVLHPVVRDVMRSGTDESDEQSYRQVCIALLDSAAQQLDPDKPGSWWHWHALLVHCDALPEWTTGLDRASDGSEHPALVLARTSFRAAEFCLFSGLHTQAFEFYSHALSVRKRILGPYDPTTLEVHWGIARVWFAQHEYDAAHAEIEDLLDVGHRVPGVGDSIMVEAERLREYLRLLRENPSNG